VTGKSMKVWFDREGDFLEVLFDPSRPGFFRETADDRVMEKVDEHGHILGFSILGVSAMRAAPVAVELPSTRLAASIGVQPPRTHERPADAEADGQSQPCEASSLD
jgi:uncharacterized protein YuzE